MKKLKNQIAYFTIALVLLLVGGGVQAQTIITKADTATLNQAADWGGTSPDGTKIGLFDNTISAVNEGALTLGGPIILQGLIFTNNLNGAVSVSNTDGYTLTNGTAGIDMSSANQNVTLNCDLTLSGAQTWIVGTNGQTRSLTVGGGISGTSPTVVLGTNGTLIFNTTSNMTIGSVDFSSGSFLSTLSSTVKNNNTTGVLTINPTAGNHYVGQINGVSGATVALSGVPTATNYVQKQFNTAGMLVKINGGVWYHNYDGAFTENLEVNNGIFINTNRNFYFNQANATLTIHGGMLIITNSFGERLGSTFGANNTSVNFTGLQDGGTNQIGKGTFELGGNSGTTDSYTLSGGLLKTVTTGNNINIGADTAGVGTTTFTLTGTGKLLSTGPIAGSQGAGAKQIFAFNGGTLVPNTFTATLITSPQSPTTPGTLVNNGGTLAPGDLGTPGKATITGNYTVNSGKLAVDIGGTAQASAFQDTVAKYDFVSVATGVAGSGNATLGGQLTVNLINNFTPATNNGFTILTAANSIIGSGTSIGSSGYVRVTSNNVPLPGKYFQAVVIGKNLILTNYGTALPTLVAQFSPTNTTGTPPLPLLFTDSSSGAITNRHWQFGDGTTLDTSSTSFSHTFTNLGVYQVVLTVQALDGSSLNATGKVSVVNPGGTLTWTGAQSSFWNTTTTNWVDALATPFLYADASGVVFDDTSSVTNVTLNLSAGPSAVSFNNSVKQYTISGSGGIGGGSGLSVNNAGGIVTLLTANTYGGATTIAGGTTLQLGNGTASGSIDNTASLQDDGLLIVNTPDNHTINNPVNGSGSINKLGAGTFAMPNGTLSGTVSVGGGKFSTTDYTNIPNVSTLSVSNGGVYEFTAGPSSWFHTIVFGSGGGGLNHSAALTVDQSGLLTGTGPLIKGGSGTMTMGQANTYTGGTIINGGSMVVNDPGTLGATGPLTMAPGTTLNYNSSVSMTNSPVDATGAVINHNNAGAIITLQQTAGTHGLGAVGGVTGATNVFAGDPAAVTTITGSGGVGLGVAGMTAKFTGGTWFNANNGQQPVNVEIDGGNLILPAGGINSQWLVAGQTLTIHGGSLVSSNSYGIRIANNFGANQGNPGTGPFTGVQDGGLLLSASGDGLQWGSTACTSFAYTLSGGTIQILAGAGPFNLGGATNGVGTTVFTLSGTGKLLAGGSSVQGANGSPAQQVFAFNGGTLAAATFNATFLQPALGAPYGKLVNNGGTLAPGDLGTAGQTIITGNYAVSNSAAVLDIDLGGTAQANAFQVASNAYDWVQVVNTNAIVTLAGTLNLRLINGFEPLVPLNSQFTILAINNGANALGTPSLTGAFTNVASGSRLAVTGQPTRSFRVTVTSTNVVLDQYQTTTPQAYFTYSPNSGVAPLTVAFNNLSNGTGLTNLWNFGDGATSTAASPTHTYTNAPSTNTVSLTVGNGSTVNTYTVSNAVVVTLPVGPSGPVPLTNTVVGASLVLSWPNGQGWVLQAQTNNLSTGLVPATNAWTRLGAATSPFTNAINPANGTVFYRLVYP